MIKKTTLAIVAVVVAGPLMPLSRPALRMPGPATATPTATTNTCTTMMASALMHATSHPIPGKLRRLTAEV
jgi:hypothetical protein